MKGLKSLFFCFYSYDKVSRVNLYNSTCLGLRTREYSMEDVPQEDAGSLFRRATRYQEFGETIAARDTFIAAVEIDSTFAKAWNSLGLVYKDLGDIDKARECFNKAFSLEPEWTDPIVSLGLLEFSLKSYKEAKEVL